MSRSESHAAGPGRADAALSEALAETQAQIARTDSKAGLLLTFLLVALAAGSVAGSAVAPPLPAVAVGGVGAVLLAAAGWLLLSVIRPNLAPGVRGTVVHWATLTPAALTREIAVDRRAEAVTALATLAVAKYGRLQRAVDLTRAGGLLLALAAVITAGGAL